MRIINVIEMVGDSIISILSFPIDEDQLSQEVVDTAEDAFKKRIEENGAEEEDIDRCIEHGFYEMGDYKCYLSWSDIV